MQTTLELNRPRIGQFADHARPRSKTASIYFAELFPEAAKLYGVPFVEMKESCENGQSVVTPITINHDFFAAALGGDSKLGHSVIYYEPEMQFYYIESVLQLYKPTSPEKLMNYYRALLMKAAQTLPIENNVLNLCNEFRSDKNARLVVSRAKSILAADSSFFSPTSPHIRIKGIELHERIARRFVDDLLASEPGQILCLHDAYTIFCKMIKQQSLEPVKRAQFKAMMTPLIHDRFDVRLRNDLQIDERSGVRGWKGVRMISDTAAGT